MEYILKTDYHCEFTISSIQRNVIVDGITTVDPTVHHSTISNIDVISIMSLRLYINEMANTTVMLNVSKQYPQYLIYNKLWCANLYHPIYIPCDTPAAFSVSFAEVDFFSSSSNNIINNQR